MFRGFLLNHIFPKKTIDIQTALFYFDIQCRKIYLEYNSSTLKKIEKYYDFKTGFNLSPVIPLQIAT
jgi:hypothetical protein